MKLFSFLNCIRLNLYTGVLRKGLKIFPFCRKALKLWGYKAAGLASGRDFQSQHLRGLPSSFLPGKLLLQARGVADEVQPPQLAAERASLPGCDGKEQRWEYPPLNPEKVLCKLQSISISLRGRSTGVTPKVHQVILFWQAVLQELAVEVFSWLPLFCQTVPHSWLSSRLANCVQAQIS